MRLFYNNIETLLSQSFGRAKTILGETAWHQLVRDFVHRHQSETPFFCEIQDEFVTFLAKERSKHDDPPWLVELCHYDWHRLYLSWAATRLFERNELEDVMSAELVLSPLTFVRSYEWPVHKIKQDAQPEDPPQLKTFILVYRDRDHKIHYRVLNAITAMLLDQLSNVTTVAQVASVVLKRIKEAGGSSQITQEKLLDLISELYRQDVLIQEEAVVTEVESRTSRFD